MILLNGQTRLCHRFWEIGVFVPVFFHGFRLRFVTGQKGALCWCSWGGILAPSCHDYCLAKLMPLVSVILDKEAALASSPPLMKYHEIGVPFAPTPRHRNFEGMRTPRKTPRVSLPGVYVVSYHKQRRQYI